MMMLDPSEEDSDDSGNGGRESPIGEGQMTDLEVCLSYLVVVVVFVFSVFFFYYCHLCFSFFVFILLQILDCFYPCFFFREI